MTTACVRKNGQSCASADEEFDRNRVVQAVDAPRFLVAFSGIGKSIGLEPFRDRHMHGRSAAVSFEE